ncbi:MAG: hypothetical protein J0M01_04495 [Dechloromonas sp.]|jgi:hypothetical protein|nr:hypothetical protein [Dechloromonas sp.]MBN8462060.1 hypothetical protein [Dechloromonas sp.]
MKRIHLHIEHLSLPGYTPAERRAFVAALERELAASGMAGQPSLPRLASSETRRVSTADLQPRTVARNAVAAMLPGRKGGGRT